MNNANQLKLINFSFQDRLIRIIKKDGEPWFVAKDVCDILQLTNPTEALRNLDDDEVNTLRISKGIRGNPNMNIINESGLYNLIFRSNKPEAKVFRKWVTSEVLPVIRKTGSYSLPGTLGRTDVSLINKIDVLIAQNQLLIEHLSVQGTTKLVAVSRQKELRRAWELGALSVKEYRHFAFDIDTPDMPTNPVKDALIFKTGQAFLEYTDQHKKENPEIAAFVLTELVFTGRDRDFVLISELYERYRTKCNSWQVQSRKFFVHRAKKCFPEITHKQKKVDGEPRQVFTGCKCKVF